MDGISDYNAQIDEYVYVDNADLIPGIFALGADSTNPYDNLKHYMREQVTMLYGSTASENHHDFRSGSFTLSEGRHITAQDQYTVLISDELAERNNLQVGDTISLSFRKGISGRYADPLTAWGDPLVVEIVGLFHVNGYQSVARWTTEIDIAANWIISDIDTVDYFYRIEDTYLYGGREHDLRYRNITFFVDDPTELDRVMKDVKSVEGFDTTYYEISIDDTMFKSTVEPLKSIRNIVAGVVGVIVAGCFIVLCVVFTMWVRSRKTEIAIYLSLGISKFKIIGQFVLEAALVALAALVLTFATCQRVPDLIGNSMLTSTIEAAQPEEKEYSWEEIGQAAMSGTTGEMFQYDSSTYAGPESIDFSFGFAQLLVLAVLELLIIIAAICKGSSFIFRLQPRQILTALR